MPTEIARRKLAIVEREPLPENLFRSVVAHAPLVAIDLVVQDRQRRVLLGWRRNPPARGYWFVPGGRVRKDETLELKIKEEARAVAITDLAARVKAAQGDNAAGTAVVISADRSVKYETVVKVMDTLQRAGIQRVGLSVQLAN
ncbi:MAG: biopolymer transporter ExbD [Burkholderiaceae bacterium]